jgi:hypothetical protein
VTIQTGITHLPLPLRRGTPADMHGTLMHRLLAKASEQTAAAPLAVGRTIASFLAALLIAGCSGGSDILTLPKIPEISVAAITPAVAEKPVGSATEIYARVARGANTCWFGGNGPLKKDYIYHAEADAPSRGGKAEIDIHVRDPSQPNPRGPKAFRINIDPDPNGGSATLRVESRKMPEPMANGMTSDVYRWAKGDPACAGSSAVAGWGAEQPAAEPEAAPPKSKTKPVAKPKTP